MGARSKTNLVHRADAADFISQILIERKSRNPRYSLRALARSLGVSPGRLSEYLTRRRRLTALAVEKMAPRLKLNAKERRRFLKVSSTATSAADLLESDFVTLRLDQFESISDPIHFLILALLETKHVQHDPIWMAKRIGESVERVIDALNRLVRLNLLQVVRGRFRLTHARLKTTTDVSSEAIRVAHRKNLEIAMRALKQVPLQLRDYSAIVTAADPKKIPEAKKMIQAFRRRLAKFLKSENRTEVFALQIQLLPLSGFDFKGDNS